MTSEGPAERVVCTHADETGSAFPRNAHAMRSWEAMAQPAARG